MTQVFTLYEQIFSCGSAREGVDEGLFSNAASCGDGAAAELGEGIAVAVGDFLDQAELAQSQDDVIYFHPKTRILQHIGQRILDVEEWDAEFFGPDSMWLRQWPQFACIRARDGLPGRNCEETWLGRHSAAVNFSNETSQTGAAPLDASGMAGISVVGQIPP